MDILYYSNYCKHSQKILQNLGKTKLVDKISFICIDKRSKDPVNGQIYIHLENGDKVFMPPNVHSVPALLLIKQSYHVLYGDDIMQHYESELNAHSNSATKNNGEPLSFTLASNSGGSNIVSEHFTLYNMTPEELSSKGKGSSRQMYNYFPATVETIHINTPPDTYRPDKLSGNITVDTLQQQRNEEIGKFAQKGQNLGIGI